MSVCRPVRRAAKAVLETISQRLNSPKTSAGIPGAFFVQRREVKSMVKSDTGARCRRVPVAEMAAQDALSRWPRICGHVICHSLGYATPTTAASIVLAAARREKHHCEWIHACYQGDPLPAVRRAIMGRHGHRGFPTDRPSPPRGDERPQGGK